MDEKISKQTGIYIAYPTSPVLKSIYRPKNYKTMVNDQHTKVGIAKDNFVSRSKGYYSNFDNQVVFRPLVVIDKEHLEKIEKDILSKIKSEFSKVGNAREWFNTSNHKRLTEIILQVIKVSGIKHEYVD